MLFIVFDTRKVKASGTIYIRSDGKVEPSEAPISNVANVTYTLDDNIYDSIIVERDNIVIDGTYKIIQGIGNGNGIDLKNRINVTVMNVEIKAFSYGINLDNSSNIVISASKISNNTLYGVYAFDSRGNSIFGNNITANKWGIRLNYRSSNNTLRNNVLKDNDYNFQIFGWGYSELVNDIDTSNTVDGKPIYYWVDKQDMRVPDDAGYVVLVNCTRMTVENLSLSKNGHGIFIAFTSDSTIARNNITSNQYGIAIRCYSNNRISQNNVTNNELGIHLDACSQNLIFENKIMNNTKGISFYQSYNNSIVHNNLMNNINQIYDSSWSYPSVIKPSINIWDFGYPHGGNYWSNYAGVDSDYDGIGNTPHVIDANNTDNYPLVSVFSISRTPYGYSVDFVSNSSVTGFSFTLTGPSQALVVFNVSGNVGTHGFCRVCVPKALINGSYVVRFNGGVITNTTYPQVRVLPCSSETYTYFYINYTLSAHTIEISGTTTIPEFPLLLVLPLFMIATLLSVIVYRRKRVESR
jgi:parallel beta-helix repeat protein